MFSVDKTTGWLQGLTHIASPNFDQRPSGTQPEVIIIHCISLPPGEYGGTYIEHFFCNRLDKQAHPYFSEIGDLKVSSHFLIQRNGDCIQFVSVNNRAWHAGESVCLGKPIVNDFSIGIELEGLDTDAEGYTEAQYQALNALVEVLLAAYPSIQSHNLFAHSDIAPSRKTDPGPYFDWSKLIK